MLRSFIRRRPLQPVVIAPLQRARLGAVIRIHPIVPPAARHRRPDRMQHRLAPTFNRSFFAPPPRAVPDQTPKKSPRNSRRDLIRQKNHSSTPRCSPAPRATAPAPAIRCPIPPAHHASAAITTPPNKKTQADSNRPRGTPAWAALCFIELGLMAFFPLSTSSYTPLSDNERQGMNRNTKSKLKRPPSRQGRAARAVPGWPKATSSRQGKDCRLTRQLADTARPSLRMMQSRSPLQTAAPD